MSFKKIVTTPKNYKIEFSFWQRLEPRARADNFQRSIQARIRDPLWMLTRQWQFGEFQAEDGGSPVKTQLTTEQTRLTRIKLGRLGSSSPGTEVIPILESRPLETLVEQERFGMNIRLAVQIGQQFERELREAFGNDASSLIDMFRSRYRFEPLTDAQKMEIDDPTQRFYAAIAGRAIDGANLLQETGLNRGQPHIPDELTLPNDMRDKLEKTLSGLQEWYTALYTEPSSPSNAAWQNDTFDYSFSVSAPEEGNKQTVLTASEYDGGNLDWYDFSIQNGQYQKLGSDSITHNGDVVNEDNVREKDEQPQVFIPTNVSFYGMPNSRWWAFEDQQTDFGNLDVKTTDLAKLLLMEFALVYGNDWYIIPFPLKTGSLCRVRSLSVTDVFGNEIPIDPIAANQNAGQDTWNMFGISISRDNRVAPHNDNGNQRKCADFLFLPPVLGRSEISPALEEVRFLRDEMANMVWAVEHTITNGLGEPQPGSEAYQEKLRRNEDQQGGHNEADEIMEAIGKPIKYQLASSVPDNWLPYVSVCVNSDSRSVQFQRAAILRDTYDNDSEPIRPKTKILTSTLETSNSPMINEETLSRAGLKIQMNVQRTRWINGSTYVWLGRRAGPGKGEGSSGLRFDYFTEE